MTGNNKPHLMRVGLEKDAFLDGEQKWRFALEGAGDGVWEFDFESKISTMSPRMMEILGRDPTSDKNSMSFNEMIEGIHPDSLAPSMAALQAVVDKKNDRYIVEQQVRHNNGSYIWLLSRGMVTSFNAEGEPLYMIGTSSDVTARKHTEELLTTARTKYQRLVENIGEEYNFFTMNTEGIITYVSPSISKMMGWTPEECLGHYSKTLTENPINKQASVHTEAGLRGEKQPPYLIEDTHKDGSTRWLEVNETPVFNDSGKVIGLEGVAHDVTKRIETENSLKAAHAKYEHLVENISDEYYFYSHNDQGYFTYVSTSITKMLGWAPEEYLTHHTKFLTTHPVNKDCIRLTSAGLKGHKQPPYMVQRYHKDGSTRWLELTETPVINEQGKVIGLEGIAHDITKRIEAEAKLKLAASVFTHAREGIMITDAAGTIIEVNNTFTEITGYRRDEAIDQTPRILKSERHPPEFYKAMWEELKKKGYWSGEIWNHHKNGDEYVVSMTTSHVLDDTGNIQSYLALFTDITTMKAHQQQLEHIAHYDVLTNLPNRVLLADRLSQAMLNSQRSNQSVAVAFLDLDGFKIVNDQYGHEVGDELLIILTGQMKASLRESDTLARIGGDEFVAVLTGLESTHDCEMLLARLLRVTSGQITVKGISLQVSASIGVTLYPQDGCDADQLMRHADQAMYIAKQAGKNRYHLFDIEQDIAIKSQRETIEHIAAALNNKDFVLYYQPKVNMRTGEVIGAEALIRWQHRDRGLLPPALFLPVIENHPLSIQIGEWVIDSALAQMSAWQKSNINLKISVNIGASQLQEENFVSRLARLLEAHPDVSPDKLELEILETSALEDVAKISNLMRSCHALGVRFALDDFGTGYSSLTYLKRLPADTLKIDQSFIRDMIEDPDDLAIVKGIVSLAEAFHRDVIAEGVETISHGTLLLGLGCELAQGYGIARPMPAENILEWAKNWLPDQSWAATF